MNRAAIETPNQGASERAGDHPACARNGDTGEAAYPRHVAIIMDGNGRWAKARFLPRVAGHKRGVDRVRTVARAAREMGIEVLTLYAFSSENWRRPAEEISDLMSLLRRFLMNEVSQLIADRVALRVIGEYRAFAPDLVALIDDALARTAAAADGRHTLVIGLNYGSCDELTRVARRFAREAADGTRDPASITAQTIEDALDTGGLPPVDLMIRTSGEQRLSNFLLWQAAYAELLFTDTLWPDFGAENLSAAIASFGQRQRRYGGL